MSRGAPTYADARDVTTQYYEQNAQAYFEATVDFDVGAIRESFLKYVHPSGLILDAGSGSGRDTLAFLRRGYKVEAFDASPALAARSTALTGIQTRVLRLEDFDETLRYDGIWACGSLIHVYLKELPRVLMHLQRALKQDGALFVSFKEGAGEVVSKDGRLFTNQTPSSLRELLEGVPGLVLAELSVTASGGIQDPNDKWVNAIACKRGG